jgi:hypothetical protein
MARKNRLVEAFQEGYNMIGLAGAASLSAITLSPIPILLGIVAETAYLLFVPDSKWYQTRLSSRFDSEVIERRQKLKAEVFPYVADSIKERFLRLEDIRQQVESHPLSGENWLREVCRKLDYLLEKFLLFARRQSEFLHYVEMVYDEVVLDKKIRPNRKDNNRDPMPELDDDKTRRRISSIQDNFDREMTKVEAEKASEEQDTTQAVLEKRHQVLSQRREYVGRIGRILTNLGHQMQLLEDSFGLINDQIRARPPEQVLAEIEGVVTQTDAMTNLLDEIATYDDMSRRFDL